MSAPLRVTHVITGLDVGGAEMMLYKLLSRLDRGRFACDVLSLKGGGALQKRIESLGVPVRSLDMRRSPGDALRWLRLWGRLFLARPRLVQTWMYHGDFFGGLAARLGGAPVVWGLHQSNLDPALNRRSTLWIARACARLSSAVPARIVCCSEATRKVHAAWGYDESRMEVIPMGFDLDAFKPDPAARAEVRAALGLSDRDFVIGLAARFDPQKDHGTFFRAAARLHRRWSKTHFLLCGQGVTADNPALARMAEEAGLGPHVHLLGPREDMPRVLASLDFLASSSRGEGFPNAVGEAMACAVPCVVTDVGDSAALVGDTGLVVPPGDPLALAAAWEKILSLGEEARRKLGEAARRRVAERYGLDQVAERYAALYERAAARR